MASNLEDNLTKSLDGLLFDAKEKGINQAECCVMRQGELLYSSDSCSLTFDIASLSKVMATVTLSAHGLDQGLFRLNTPITSVLDHLPFEWKNITIGHLLAHSSGLVAWRPFFVAAMDMGLLLDIFTGQNIGDYLESSASRVWDEIKTSPLLSEPGSERRYSDTGFIVLGKAIEKAFSKTHEHSDLSSLFDLYVSQEIGLEDTHFRPLTTPVNRRIAPTGLVRPRPPATGQEGLFPHKNRLLVPELPGIVDDDNAYALGGVAGHAGLFSTAVDVAKYGDWLLSTISDANSSTLSHTLRNMCLEDSGPIGPRRTLGFDLPTPPNSSVGESFGSGPKGAIGHLGFTGCSMWVDRDRDTTVAILTNRVFPDRGNSTEISTLRRGVHTVVSELIPLN